MICRMFFGDEKEAKIMFPYDGYNDFQCNRFVLPLKGPRRQLRFFVTRHAVAPIVSEKVA